jgi:hypothetical protein
LKQTNNCKKEEKEMINDCKHERVYEGICYDCNLCMSATGQNIDMSSDYSSSHVRAVKSTGKIFREYLSEKNLPENVKRRVYAMTSQVTHLTCRKSVRERILFAYCYLAVLHEGYHDIYPSTLAEILNIDKKNIKPAIKLASGIGARPLPQNPEEALLSSMVVIKPYNSITEYCHDFNLMNECKNILAMAESLIENNECLQEYKPNIMALALIKYYLSSKGQTICDKKKRPVKMHTHYNISVDDFEKCLAAIEEVKK